MGPILYNGGGITHHARPRAESRLQDGAGTGVVVPQGNGLFAIDEQQRIVNWSDGAAALTGIPAEAALTRPCHDILRGRDAFGRVVCQPGCAAFAALCQGRLTAGCSLAVQGRQATPLRLRCDLHALPPVPGGAIGRLSLGWAADLPAPLASTGQDGHREGADVVRQLTALAALATSLSGHDLLPGLERALDILREATGSESAELFLAEPAGRDMLLTIYRGPFRSAFYQTQRFAPGEGFPGLVMAERQPAATNTLQQDGRFVRTRVKARGYQSYLCMPLDLPGGLLGTVCLASRDPALSLESAQRLLTWASVPLTTALQANLLQLRQPAPAEEGAPAGPPADDLERMLHLVLRRALTLAHADGGLIELFNPGTGDLAQRAVAGLGSDMHCPALDCPHGETCPALGGAHGIALVGARQSWPESCRRARKLGQLTCCVPLRVGDEPLGLLRVVYQHDLPDPPTRHLRVLMEAADAAAVQLKQAREHAVARRREAIVPRQWHQPRSESGSAPAGRLTAGAGQPNETEPFLAIRCLGQFELQRQGALITPEAFKRRKALTLLKILLLHAGRPVPSEALIEWLWPESDPETGANRLYVIVHHLREMIEPSGSGSGRDVIRTSTDHYIFAPAVPCWLDLAEFRAAIAAGHEAEALGDQPKALAAYDTAAQLYRGDLLEDERYAEWCWLEREHLRETHLDALQRLARLAWDAGDLSRAANTYRRALQVDPVREEIQRRLIECLWQLGRRDEALRQYEFLRAVLRRELDITPLPETEELVRRILGAAPHARHSADSV